MRGLEVAVAYVPVPVRDACHLIRAGNLANLEEVGRIAVLEAREIQEHLSIRGLRIVFSKP